MSPSHNEPIAIVGNACRFPGDATSPSKLWELLKEPREVSRQIDRFQYAGWFNKDGHYHGASNVQDSYLLSEDPRLFDAQFFNIPPGEAESIDPQQRILLETVYEAIESSGLALENLKGSNTAVYVGVMCDDYGNICYVDPEAIPTYAATGTARSILSNRVSFVFDWRGPSMTIDTACSSSLVALHQGVQVLRSGSSNVAVAAGANLIFSPNMFIAESNLNMLSPSGKSQMWDANADGYARGEGMAAVVMKRLSDAIADGDHIECIIRETGVNQDGHTPGITMPSQEAQTRLIHDTYRRAGLDLAVAKDRPQYFEAHGTGTKAGDGVESKAIYKAFFGGEDAESQSNLWVGSIKTVIGHTEGTAGIAGVMKASLAIQNKTIPPNLHLHNLNPEIAPFYGKVQIAQTAQDWPAIPEGGVRRASINSFGFGGTNAHAIIEAYEPNDAPAQAIEKVAAIPLPLTFSATSEKTLTNLMSNFLDYISENDEVDLNRLAWTLHDRRSTFTYRSSVVGQSREDLIAKLQKAVDDQNSVRGSSAKKNLLGVFSGQGAQWATMGRDIIASSKFAENIIDQLEHSLNTLPEADRPSWSLKGQMMIDAAQSRIGEGELSQPLCTAVQVMLVDMLKASGIVFDTVVGHSSGEIGAAYAAGFVTAHDAIRIAFYRGRYAYLARGPEGQRGGMLAAGTTLEDARELCDLPAFEGRVSVAAYNSSSSVTLSGDLEAIEEVKEVLEDEKKFNRQLKVDTAYHSHHMIPCSKKYYEALDACNIQILKPSGETKWYSSVYDGKLMEQCEALKHQYWVDNMVNIVLFATSLECALNECEIRPTQAIEVGPHPALKGPASTVIEEAINTSLPYTGTLARGQNDVDAMASAFGYLWSQFGRAAADLKSYYQLFSENVPAPIWELPSYPFNHDRVFWYESRKSRVNRLREDPAHILLGTRTDTSNEREYRWRNYIHAGEIPWLQGHKIQGQTLFPAAGFLAMAVEAARFVGRAEAIQAIELHDSAIHRALAIADDKGIETLFTLSNVSITETGEDSSVLTANFACDACLQKQSENFVSIASGKLVMTYGTPSSTALVKYPVDAGHGMLDVDTELFYAYLASIGYNYAGLFKGITSMQRTTSLAQGEICTTLPEEDNLSKDAFLLHPSTLDVAFQAIFAAISYPGDNALWALHIPTTIRRITINPAICPYNGGIDQTVRFSATSLRADDGSFAGCVDIFPADSEHSLCQVEGLEVSPVSPPTEKDDRGMFGKTTRWLSSPDADSNATPLSLSAVQEQEKVQVDRLAVFYLRKILTSTDADQAHLRLWAQNVLTTVGNQSWANQAIEDAEDVVVEDDSIFKPTLELLKTIGEESTEESADNDALLKQFYSSAYGAAEARETIASLVVQMSHRYPHMRILELGTGNGSITKAVLPRLGALFSAYTCTDTTNEHFAELVEEHGDNVFTETLDFEQDLEEQGFSPASFDLVIAGSGLHMLKDREQGMHKLRSLIRPGGYLLAQQLTNAESVHVGLVAGSLIDAEDASSAVPALGEYDELLQSTGFSGIDTVTPDSANPFSVFISQAVDQQINAIRAPLTANKSTIEQILLIGGQRFQISRMIESIKTMLAPFCNNITTIRSIDDLDGSMLAARPLVLSLTELDEPFFQDLSEHKFKALQTLFFRSRYVVWANHGANGANPYANVMKGVVRCLLVEIPHLHAQMFNIEGRLKPEQHAQELTESLIRLHIADSWKDKVPAYNPLWTTERELMLENDKLFVTRYDPEKTLNDHYNALRRNVVTQTSTRDNVVAITSDKNLQQYRLTPHVRPEDDPAANATVEVRHSASTALKVGDIGAFFLSIGTAKETGKTVLVFSKHHQSSLNIPKTRLVNVDVEEKDERALLLSVAAQLTASALLQKCSAGDKLVLHEPSPVLAGLVAEKTAKIGAQTTFTTCDKEAAAERGWKHIHAFSTGSDLSRIITPNTSLFANFAATSETGDVASRLASFLPFRARRQTAGEYFPTQSIVYSDTTEEQIVDSLIKGYKQATASASTVDFSGVSQTKIHELAADKSLGAPLTTMDWTDATPFDASVTLAMDEVTFRPDRTYFLIGMTGSLGLSTVQYMMERGARHFALSSRRPNLDKIFVAQAIENFGADIRGFALDITSRADLHRVHKEICDSMPPIAGVANAALIMRDGLFMESTAETMNQALAPKIDGSIYLDELFSAPDLDFFILYSSLVYITGNIGQTSYAAGNGFMVSLCHGRRQRGLVGSVMNLGGINGIGYITRTDHNILSRLDILGYGIMSELDYKYFFAESVMAGVPGSGRDCEVSAGLRFVNPKQEKSPPKWVEDPKFNHYVLDRSGRDGGDKGADGALSTKAQLLEAETPKDAFNIILGALIAMLAKKLDLPPNESIHSDVAIVEMGVDSLVAVDMRSWFSNQFDHDIPIIKILGGATLADLVEDTVDNLSADICPNLAGAATEEPAAEPAAEAAVDSNNEAPTYIVDDDGNSTDSDTPDDATISTDLDEPAEPSPSKEKTQTATQAKQTETAVATTKPAAPALKFVRTAKMTHGCSRFWFLRQYLEEPNCFNVLVQSRLTGQVDVTRVQEAVRKVGMRHESLRTAYYSDDKGNAMMGVLPDSLLRLEVENVNSEEEAKEAFKKLSAHNFDIERGEVIRVRLATLAPNDHIIMFAVHHIAMDGFSFNLMLRDLDMLYQGKPVPQIPLQFTDFAIQQRKDIDNGRMRSDVTFWKKTFASLPDPLPLFPFANVGARNALVKYEHEEVEMVLDNATSKQIRELCRKNRCTAFHFFLATFQVFLSRWLSVDDFCIGIADANRKDLKSLSTVGFLLNLIPLRFGALPKKASFANVLAAAKQNAYSALNHSALPFDLLLEELNMPRSSSHSPLFQAFLDYRQLAVKTPPLLQSKAEGESNFGATAYDVVLDVTDVASADLTIKWQTQKSLYSMQHTQAMMDSYMHLVRQFIKDFAAPVDGVSPYRPEDIKSAVELGRGPQFDSTWTETLSQKVDDVSAKYPQDIALRDGLGNTLTYAAMNRTIDQISEELVKGNVKPGDKVGIFQQPGAPWICSLLATWRSGAVYVPLDPRNGLARLGATVGVVEPSAIICDNSVAKDVSELSAPSNCQVINVDQVRKADASVTRRPNLATPNGSAIIVSSSGSTGVPKCIEVRHSSLLNLFEGDSKNWTLGRPNSLQQSAYSFDISMDQIFTGLVNGGTLYVASEEQRSHPEGIANIIANNNITYTMATPSEYSNWINYAGATMSKGASWRLANIGGEGWNSTLRDSFATLNLPELKIQNCYGPAESSVWTTRVPIEYPAESTLIPAGPALANYSLYILDGQSNVVPAGVTGEILIGGAGTAVGYYKNTELTNEKFILDKNASSSHVAKGWNRAYRTGDKGYLMEDGNLVVQGRITGDTQIKLRGFRIELEDIENTITRASDGVLARVVASVRGEGQSSFLAAFAEFADGYPAEQQQAYLNKLLSKVPLPQYMKPNMIVPVERIPLNSHNKVNRLVIATFPLHSETATAEAGPTEFTATEETVWNLFKEILPESVMRSAPASGDSDFFALGGNSLLTVRLQARIRDSFGLFVPLVRIIESSTLSRLASTLDALMADTEINWEAETAIPSDMINMSTKRPSTPAKTSDLTVVLTGASGFIGRHILQRLIADDNVSRIHCVAHRDRPAELPTRQKLNAVLKATSKVTVHGGDLEAPLLGLSKAEFANLAGEADLIIHSGANRSFWTAYESVRAANVQSTKELARLAAVALQDHQRVVPLHFLSGSEALASDPENDGSNGYVASKWASERFLEKYSKHFALPVHMHRQLPVPNGREAVDQELDDILQEFVDVAARMPELPDSNAWRGHYDLIPADRLADDVVDQAMGALKSDDDSTHQHSHYSSVRMDIAKVLKRLETIPEYTDSDRPRIPAHVWVGKAKIEGFRYQFSTMNMSLTDGEGKSMAMLTR